MKRIIFILGLLLLWPVQVLAQTGNVNDFTIDSFTGEYRLSRDNHDIGQMAVKETIVAVFPSYDQNHGILRAIPETYGEYDLGLSISQVTDEDGRTYPYTSYENNGNLVLKIGDANTYVHGRTTYVIDYQVKNIITFYDEHDEFFWDINGDQWSQPFGTVMATVYVPDELVPPLKDEQRCYTGSYGSTASNCRLDRTLTGEGVEVTATAQNLRSSENLSVVLAFNKGTFYEDPWPARKRMLQAASAVIPPVVLLWYAFSRWRRYGRDAAGRGVIVPQYTPQDDINPLSAEVILNERMKTSAISAAIIELAVSGYIKIYETQKKKLIGSDSEYSLELTKDASDLPQSLKDVIEGLFSSSSAVGEKIELKDKANKLYSTAQQLNKDVPKGLAKRKYFVVDPNKARSRWIGRGIALFIVGMAFMFFAPTVFFGIGLSVGSVIIMAFSGAMPARTKQGAEAKEHLLGLKDYIQLAEKDRIKFLQSPEGVKQYGDPTKPENQVKLFEKLLPYAMLFGLEKQWAKEFESLYTQPPEWYNTYRGTFTPVILADSLGSFNTSTSTAFTAPSSSGSSGFSGGGFSGGGGGGGGGGGW